MATIEINGKKIAAEPGSMIIEVADKVGFQIPRFCYHKKLSVAANCRMCLVDVEKAEKPLPACATPVTEGMRIWTKSPKALMAQKSVMEFLLINHPLDCPICDQGGECELQDVAMGYGNDTSQYTEGKRSILDKNIGPLIATNMTRCIQCTRCVRFGSEVAGFRELGATGRGEHLEITTFMEKNIESEVSGNIIDLCPVGALLSKPYLFKARGWELTQKSSIAPHDCFGSHIYVHSRRGKVLRVVPKENELVNETWISDRDRFSYEGLYHEERLLEPKIKKDGQWQAVSWLEALEFAAELIQNSITTNPAELGALVSPNTTIEESYLLQKLMRSLGSNNIDHRLRQQDFAYQDYVPAIMGSEATIKNIEHLSNIILVGSDIRKENPMFALKIRKASLNNAKIMIINPVDFEMNFAVTSTDVVPSGDLVLGLAKFLKVLLINVKHNVTSLAETLKKNHLQHKYQDHTFDIDETIKKLDELLNPINISDEYQDMINQFQFDEKSLLVVGALCEQHPFYGDILFLAQMIRQLIGIKLTVLSEGANGTGCWLTGVVPHRLPVLAIKNPGLTAKKMLEKSLQSYILWNIDPELDCADGLKASKILSQANSVIAITSFESETLRDLASVMLPLAPFTETEGRFCNLEGNWEAFEAANFPLGNSRSGWKILRMLGNVLNLEQFDYTSINDILQDLFNAILGLECYERTGKKIDYTFSNNKIDFSNVKNNIDQNKIEKNQTDLLEWNIPFPTKLHTISQMNPSHQRAWHDKQTAKDTGMDKKNDHTMNKSISTTVLKIAQVPLYQSDNLVRRSAPLQKMKDSGLVAVQLNSRLAKDLENPECVEVMYGGNSLQLPVIINDRVPDQTILIPMAMKKTLALGGSYVYVTIKPVRNG